MKKILFSIITFILIFSLTACGAKLSAANSSTESNSLSLEGQLLVGTFKLENTDLAVTSSEANELLPLWEALQSLSTSSIAAVQEVDAVISQIESTMTQEQIASIRAMKLTQADLDSMQQQASTASTSSSTTATNSESMLPQVNSGSGSPAGAAVGGGNPPADLAGAMASPLGQTSGITQTSGTQAATVQTGSAAKTIPTALINSLIALLEKKIG